MGSTSPNLLSILDSLEYKVGTTSVIFIHLQILPSIDMYSEFLVRAELILSRVPSKVLTSIRSYLDHAIIC